MALLAPLKSPTSSSRPSNLSPVDSAPTTIPSPDLFHHSGSGYENPWQQNRSGFIIFLHSVGTSKWRQGRRGGGANGAKEVMEGVRCSRRNGRGWRCCQPTAVGFSGCEHHPDLGRLRPKGKRLSAGNAVSQQPSCSATAFSPETVASPEKLLRLLERLSSWSPEDSPATMSMARLLFMGGELGGHSLGALQQQAQQP
ncbi:hypothetical protein RJ640_020098 [Escallonia rubra]|uniref:WRC domain-containing protein n=1 Tax=Escallonia rubra TaxID=112253 RepID=A0AA88UF12_9ASTE|nr:hypothetical protein RJ640_020098 [Escallonia rubra]